MKIGILQTGRVHDDLGAEHGDFDEMFARLLAKGNFTYESYWVQNDAFPETVNDCDGWLISGSKFSAYENLPWITKLEQFLRDAYAADVPIVGICFGHQVLATALGGVVEKYSDGWAVGPHSYEMQGRDEPMIINAWHQDQVTVKPASAKTVATSQFCEHAALLYGKTAFSIQAHPEFSTDFTKDLLDVRRTIIPKDRADAADQSFDNMPPTPEVAQQIIRFFKERSIA